VLERATLRPKWANAAFPSVDPVPERVAAACRQVLEVGGSQDCVDGVSRWSIQPLRGDLLAVVSDVAAEARTIKEELSDMGERYRRMGDLIPFGFWVADPHGNMTYLSESFLEMAGATMSECGGLGWTRFLHGADRERTIAEWRECTENDVFWDHEHRFRGKDGQFFSILSRGVPLHGDDGEVRAWVGVHLDVTDRKRFVAELRAARDVAEAASKAKDEFLAILSHELRTPLNPLLVAVQLLEGDASVPPELRSQLALIRRNAELEARLIDDLLDLTRVLRGKLQLYRERVDVHSSILNALDICMPDAQEKKLNFALKLDAGDFFVFGDAARLQQIWWNLIRNAIQFTPDGGDIVVHTENPASGQLCVRIRDNGIGIEAELLPRLFEPFRARETAASAGGANPFGSGGLGLGLAITKALVDMHGGRIAATSEGQRRGSVFSVHLDTTMPQAPVPSPSELAPAPSARVRILLVDDHKDTCALMESMLSRRGYEVMTAWDVKGALDLALEHDFDLLVSDLGLPDGTGFDLMRALSERKRIPAIALSGYGRDDDVRRSKEAGFDEHMTKPVNIAKLEVAIRRLAFAPRGPV
jgi:PAS domain S-box-containing protein